MAKMANTVRRCRLVLALALAAFVAAALLFSLLSEPPIEPEWDHQIPEVVLWES